MALAAMAASGCGVDPAQEGRKANGQVTTPAPAGQPAPPRSKVPLPQRPAGLVAIDGEQQGSLADAARRGFHDQAGTRSEFLPTAENQAATDLCAGRVDVIEIARPLSENEKRACAGRGVDVVGPLQVGADAIVLATKNESDVGGDCLTSTEARTIFQAGSPYDNWNQLGFFDIPLSTTGRDAQATTFTFFGTTVLQRPAALLADMRSDYRVRNTDPAVRLEVTNATRLLQAQRAIIRHRAYLRQSTRAERKSYVDAAVRVADRAVLKQIARTNARNKRLRRTVDPVALAAHNKLIDDRAKRRAAAAANARFDARLAPQNSSFARATLAAANAPGVVGFFRFSYYQLYEEQLRPFEIDLGVPETSDGQAVGLDQLPPGTKPGSPLPAQTVGPNSRKIYAGPNCVFPSPVTITSGAYPFSRRLFLFTSRQALKRPEVLSFMTYFLTNARQIAETAQLVPITDRQQSDAIFLVTGRRPAVVAAPSNQSIAPAGTTTTPATTPGAQAPGAPPGPGAGAQSAIPGVSTRAPVPAGPGSVPGQTQTRTTQTQTTQSGYP
ncbi:MAG TPA: substrate-binding domain-containing protein [Solirubrobacteraceae bacterium]|nr:substrate-binding domain-containing protein [Solirubrobacteraceae bacterium]